ncbi:MAG: OmpA family protein [Planctomycetaceae bacterium]|nr:OmpA family protein [Planctomycetaceae bacterium]
MNARTVIVTAASILAVLPLVGCNEKDTQLRILARDKTILTDQNEQLRKDIKAANDQMEKSTAELAAKDAELVTTRQKITELEGLIGQPPLPPPGKPTWVVAGDVLFLAGKATLSTQRVAELDRIVDVLKNKGQAIRIIGHTDSDPIVQTARIWRDNYDLSNARAMAVKQYLVSRGLDGAAIETAGMGPDKPVTSNATRTGKAQNRRVEIYILVRQTAEATR